MTEETASIEEKAASICALSMQLYKRAGFSLCRAVNGSWWEATTGFGVVASGGTVLLAMTNLESKLRENVHDHVAYLERELESATRFVREMESGK